MTTYSSFQDVASRCRIHRCMHKLILSSDNPLAMLIGFACSGCGEEWHTGVSNIKTNPPPPVLFGLLKTPEGRVELAKALTCDGAVYIWQEEEV